MNGKAVFNAETLRHREKDKKKNSASRRFDFFFHPLNPHLL
jgi:hypothetical protein